MDLHEDVLWDVLLDVAGWPRLVPSVRAVTATTGRLGPTTRGRLQVAGAWLPFSVRRFHHRRGFSLRVAGVPVAVEIQGATLTVRGLLLTDAALKARLEASA